MKEGKMDEAIEKQMFYEMLWWMVEDGIITQRSVFRLAFMSICNGDPQSARDLKDKYVKKLSQKQSRYVYFEGYMNALCDEVVALGKKSLSSQAQATP